MPKRKKRVTELPTEEAVKRLFPKKVRERVKEIAHEKDKAADEKPSQPQSTR